MHKQSLDEPDKFWGDAARSTLKWFRDFDRVSQGGFETGDVAWFTGGQLNACYNCVDQHLPKRAKQVQNTGCCDLAHTFQLWRQSGGIKYLLPPKLPCPLYK